MLTRETIRITHAREHYMNVKVRRLTYPFSQYEQGLIIWSLIIFHLLELIKSKLPKLKKKHDEHCPGVAVTIAIVSLHLLSTI